MKKGPVTTALFFSGCVILMLFSCTQSDEPTITLLTFKQDTSTPTNNTDDWIFVTDESGNLLDIKQFEAGQPVVLSSNKLKADQKVNVTIFQYSDTTNEVLFFYSYLGMTLNQNWLYKKISTRPTFIEAGKFTLAFTNYPATNTYFFISTNDNNLTGAGSPPSWDLPLPSIFPTRLSISSYRDNVPVYASFYVAAGYPVSLDFLTDLKPMEHTLSYDVTDAILFSVDINAFDYGATPNYPQGHIIANCSSTGEDLIVGWPDGFQTYKTNVSAVYPHAYKAYYKLGSGATTTPFLDLPCSIINSDYKNFDFTASDDYQMRNSRWKLDAPSGPSISWYVYSSPTGIQKFSGVPYELKKKYPILATASLIHDETGFTRYLDGFTYDDYIKYIFNVSTATKPYPTEYQWTEYF